MKKEPRVYLEDIYESIEKIEEYTANASEEAFLSSTEQQDSVIRRLEIIGEAVKNLPDELRQKYPEIPWKQVAGMRDILIHEYTSVSIKRVWSAVKKDLPVLKKIVQTMLTKINN